LRTQTHKSQPTSTVPDTSKSCTVSFEGAWTTVGKGTRTGSCMAVEDCMANFESPPFWMEAVPSAQCQGSDQCCVKAVPCATADTKVAPLDLALFDQPGFGWCMEESLCQTGRSLPSSGWPYSNRATGCEKYPKSVKCCIGASECAVSAASGSNK
jgi:hypothetical protein